MHQFHADVGIAQLSKHGEELCGDKVEVIRTCRKTIIVLSDGLGSGVKANILATLTTKIASSMLKRGIPLEDVVSTVAETLPVCKQRKIAYSTLHILTISDDGIATIVEFDCPHTFLVRSGMVIPFPAEEMFVAGKLVKFGKLELQENDYLAAVSDGVVHAGIGGLLKLGWGWRGVAKQLESECLADLSVNDISKQIIGCCEGYYLGSPGDDSTAVLVKVRKPVRLTLLTGPPSSQKYDDKIVRRFMSQPGKKIISGGTTANIVSRETGRELHVDLSYFDASVPPTGSIEGVDLVTEGLLTLNIVVERLLNLENLRTSTKQDGATRLARMLVESDMIDVLAGGAINPAHQNPNFPLHINLKVQVLSRLQDILTAMGKDINVEWF